MTKMSDAKPTTITAITHSPTPPVTTLCFSPDTTGCLKTAREKGKFSRFVLIYFMFFLEFSLPIKSVDFVSTV